MNARRTVVLGLSIAGALYIAAYGLQYANDEQGRHIGNPLPKLGGAESFVGWSVLFLVLMVMAEIPPTAQLAASFTMLVLLAILFSYGVVAFQNLIALMGNKVPVETDTPQYRSDSGGNRPE